MVDAGVMSQDGKDAVLLNQDPCHDGNVKLVGWPDEVSGRSVIRKIPKDVTIQMPANLVAVGATWDLHIAAFPWHNAVQFYTSTTRGNNVVTFTSATTSYSLGGVSWTSVATGADANWFQGSPAQIVGGNLTIDDVILRGPGRLVGMGIEVRDATNQFAAQGTLTAYRQAQAHFDPNVNTWLDSNAGATVLSDYSFSGFPFRMPPVNRVQASQFSDRIILQNVQGGYMVIPINGDNPPEQCRPVLPVCFDCGDDDITGTVGSSVVHVPTSPGALSRVSTNATLTAGYSRNMAFSNIQQEGMILSGLQTSASVNLSVVWYWETFPSLKEIEILSSANPSPAFDPIAIKVIQDCVQHMPICVEVGKNPAGEWFWDVVQNAARVLSPMLKTYPHPLAQAGGTVADFIGNYQSTPPKKKRKKTKQNNALLAAGSRGGKNKKNKIQGPMMPQGG